MRERCNGVNWAETTSTNFSNSCRPTKTPDEVQILQSKIDKAITKAIASGDETEPLVLTSRETFVLKREERSHKITITNLTTRLKLSQDFGKVLDSVIDGYGDVIASYSQRVEDLSK